MCISAYISHNCMYICKHTCIIYMCVYIHKYNQIDIDINISIKSNVLT